MLSSLASAFEGELNEVRAVFLEAHAADDVHCEIMDYCPVDDGCLVSAWDAWNRFLRSLYLASATGSAVGAGGQAYVPQVVRNTSEAIEVLRLGSRPRGSGIPWSAGEPKWFVATAARPIGELLQLQNEAVIADALAQSDIQMGDGFELANPLETLRATRNYVAHKSIANAAALRQIFGSGSRSLTDFLREPTHGGSTRFDDWLDAAICIAWDAAR